MAGGTREGDALAARRRPSRGSHPPGRSRRRRHRRRAPLRPLRAHAAEPRANSERRLVVGRGLEALGVLLALLVDLELLLEELPPVHLRVKATVLEEVTVRAALGDAAVVEDEDLVRVLHRGDAVRDDDGRALAHDAPEPEQ